MAQGRSSRSRGRQTRSRTSNEEDGTASLRRAPLCSFRSSSRRLEGELSALALSRLPSTGSHKSRDSRFRKRAPPKSLFSVGGAFQNPCFAREKSLLRGIGNFAWKSLILHPYFTAETVQMQKNKKILCKIPCYRGSLPTRRFQERRVPRWLIRLTTMLGEWVSSDWPVCPVRRRRI